VGLQNGSAAPETFRLRVDGAAAESAEFYRLRDVIAADGREVPDAIQDMPGGQVVVQSGTSVHALIRIPSVLSTGVRTVRVSVGNRRLPDLKWTLTTLSGVSDAAAAAPDVVVWGYATDAPISTAGTARQVVAFQQAAGVNTFVIHPASLPLPGDKPGWRSAEARLRSDLGLYRDAHRILLYTAWDDRLQHDGGVSSRLDADIREWTTEVVRVLAEEGFQPDRWAVYPIDEPEVADYRLLGRFVKAIHAANPRVQIYANPGSVDRRELLPGGRLASLIDQVDLWQPQIDQAADLLGPEMLRRGDRPWYIYQVGKAPAKAISPTCYRRLGWDAWRRGASGFGFWSFSDTGGSSAWDDLDGSRPDWAVVYESPAGLVSSRRWEAFRQGVREYRALAACSSKSMRDPMTADCESFRRAVESELAAHSCN